MFFSCSIICLLTSLPSVLKSRAVVVFGLNDLSGKTIDSQGSAVGAWNSSNAESLLRYTVNKGYIVHGWELGKNSYSQVWIVSLETVFFSF